MQQIVMPRPSLDVIKTAMDSLLLPVRRPILFVPFVFTLALLYVLVVVVVIGTLLSAWAAGGVTTQQIAAVCGAAALVVFTAVLAVEAITDLTVRSELGRDLDLGESVLNALGRFPATLATVAAMTAGIIVGLLLLIVPGLVVGARWFLAPNVVLLGGRGVRDAITLSWQMTGEHFVPLAGLVLLVGVGSLILNVPLSHLPVVGHLLTTWLGFAWGAMALAMAYVRLGGPVDLG